MKKILSLALAGVMMVSALPVAYAADTQDYSLGTAVSVEGASTSEYEVKVPAKLEAGTAGNVVATGIWKSDETLIVTTADEIEVTNEETGATTKVPVVFEGINAAGNDLAAMSISKTVNVEKGDILFGTWTGVVEYNVEFKQPVEISITSKNGLGGSYSFKAVPGTTWAEWIESDFNTLGIKADPGYNDAIMLPSMYYLYDLGTSDCIYPDDIIVADGYSIN